MTPNPTPVIKNLVRKLSEEHKRKISEARKGFKMSEEQKIKLSLAQKGKPRGGNPKNWKHSEKTKQKIREMTILKTPRGKDNFKWKGNKVGYGALHSWVVRNLGKTNHCEVCRLDKVPEGITKHGKIRTRYFQWANLSQKYKRDLTDWKQMCVKCHYLFDKNYKDICNNGLKITKHRFK